MLLNNCTFQLLIEPELRTNSTGSAILQSQPYSERVYEPEGTGVMVKKGQEVVCRPRFLSLHTLLRNYLVIELFFLCCISKSCSDVRRIISR